jgi:anaerobic ribonucleoside-triphosphate reductase activating protein
MNNERTGRKRCADCGMERYSTVWAIPACRKLLRKQQSCTIEASVRLMPAHLNLHAVLTRTRSNGPGVRTAFWLQGCSIRCPDCFNPETHSPEPRRVVEVKEILADLMERESTIEGITVSGGEPLDQAPGLLELLRGVRALTGLTIVLFSGYPPDSIDALPEGPQIVALADVLIADPYRSSCSEPGSFPGSRNQHVEFITDVYDLQDFAAMPHSEVIIDHTGTLVLTGTVPPDIRSYPGTPIAKSYCAEVRTRSAAPRATRADLS